MHIFSAAENAAGNVSWLIVVDTDCSTAANLFLLAAPERLAICKSNSAHLAGDSAAWRRVELQAPTQTVNRHMALPIRNVTNKCDWLHCALTGNAVLVSVSALRLLLASNKTGASESASKLVQHGCIRAIKTVPSTFGVHMVFCVESRGLESER